MFVSFVVVSYVYTQNIHLTPPHTLSTRVPQRVRGHLILDKELLFAHKHLYDVTDGRRWRSSTDRHQACGIEDYLFSA